ncbi:hypothetical protein CF65_02755 [Aggregatibacter actinomycetemcomitans HK1651]|nr:hypothetical protein CF65_02755 [Aggregatibacter actinomycetemcomitans HK1651]
MNGDNVAFFVNFVKKFALLQGIIFLSRKLKKFP